MKKTTNSIHEHQSAVRNSSAGHAVYIPALCFAAIFLGCSTLDTDDSQSMSPPPMPIIERHAVVIAQSESREVFSTISGAQFELRAIDSSPSTPESLPSPNRGAATLAWDASPEPAVTGYRIWFGAGSGNYTNSAAVGNVTQVSIRNLAEGVPYRFAATAYDAAGVESDFSNEVTYVPPTYINMRHHSWVVESYGIHGATNEMKMSTNLIDWWTVMTFVGDGNLKAYLHTNSAQAWFRLDIK